MANRYWVGGTATWNATAGSKWSATSGGAGGVSVPTTSDNVFFNGNSGAGVVTIGSAGADCLTLDCTGFGGSFAQSGTPVLFCLGNATLGGKNIPCNIFVGGNISSNGGLFQSDLYLGGATTILDALAVTGLLQISSAVVDANDFNVTCGTCEISGSTTSVTMGSGTWTVTGNAWTVSGSGTIVPETSTLKLTALCSFSGGGKTYNTVWFASGATGSTVAGSNTISEIKIDPNVTVTFTAGTTQTVATLNWPGTPSQPITVGSSSPGNAWSLSDSSGNNAVSYCVIQDSTAGGGATFTAMNSTNNGNNTGWVFTAAGGGAFLFL